MGNRTYLLAKKESSYITLFEGNNSLGLFWVMLMTPKDLEAYTATVKEYFELEEAGTLPGDFDISMRLTRDTAIQQALARKSYIEQYYPLAIELFNDWVMFLKNEPCDDNRLYLELSEYTWFYPTIEAFQDDLLAILQSIDHHTETPFEYELRDLTGFEGWDNGERFRTSSKAYQQFEDRPCFKADLQKNSNDGSRYPRIKVLLKTYLWLIIMVTAAATLLLWIT